MRWQLYLKHKHLFFLLIFLFFGSQLHFKYLFSPLKANRLAALLKKQGGKSGQQRAFCLVLNKGANQKCVATESAAEK